MNFFIYIFLANFALSSDLPKSYRIENNKHFITVNITSDGSTEFDFSNLPAGRFKFFHEDHFIVGKIDKDRKVSFGKEYIMPELKASNVRPQAIDVVEKFRKKKIKEKIAKKEKHYLKNSGRSLKRKEYRLKNGTATITLKKTIHTELCTISAHQEFILEGKTIDLIQGPIPLEEIENIYQVNHPQFPKFFGIQMVAKNRFAYPVLYYVNQKKQIKSIEKFEKIISLCKKNLAWKALTQSHHACPQNLGLPRSEGKLGQYPNYNDSENPSYAALLSSGSDALKGRLALNKGFEGTHLDDKGDVNQDELYVQSLIFMADELGLTLYDDFVEARKKGTDVRVFIDPLSPFLDVRDKVVRNNTPIMYQNMMAAGIPVYGFTCQGGLAHSIYDELKLSLKLGDYRPIDTRFHQKWYHVKNKLGHFNIYGGRNYGNDYFDLSKVYWEDEDAVITGNEGPLNDIRNIFLANSKRFEHKMQSDLHDPRKSSCFNPYHPINDKKRYNDFFVKFYTPFIPHNNENHTYAQEKLAEIKSELPQFKFNYHRVDESRVISARPQIDEDHIEQAYLDMINNAQEYIRISNSYFIPSPELLEALINASQRGVKIKIITNSKITNDVFPISYLTRYYSSLLINSTYYSENPIEVREWQSDLDGDNTPERGTNHSKYIAVDSRLHFIGSHNLDPRSEDRNVEGGVALKSESMTVELQEHFDRNLQFSKNISFKQALEWRNPPTFLKALKLKKKGFYPRTSLRALFFDRAMLNIVLQLEGLL